ncbi:MAG: hypothetical protein A3H98_04465 [Bacteroidetes bacterium RIFCSPLOWO2_02_FULL_36_8]|nr:MAG: hypothetical protein A3H98_04465 [Bacteroidetes bacterium RIFCSPLOWO2_02_FULL_36_8]OFY71886.1 MAG: hypothetical protein A3G23_05005 [Bacteroidetes bacterium RIFCSPLOWO2_12_FULL_37_12]
MDYRDPSSIPLPTTDDDFERLCLLIARDKYGAEYYRYGRRGQKQYGIDIYSTYYDGRYLQCKLCKKEVPSAILISQLKNDLAQAVEKFPDLKQFIFAVSIETSPEIQNTCKTLSAANIIVTPWFWNQMQEDIARSKWLLRYYLNYIPGAQWIYDDFIQAELMKGNNENWQPLNFYSGNYFTQWYGIIKKWDAQREHYSNICQEINNSFSIPFNDNPIATIVRGDGGSGKSVLLRRIAHDLRNQFTVYWIADNAEDFLKNEWLYDIENNPNEKYLLVLEDWYRNFSKTNDRITAKTLLQKVKTKSNVRLLIGDRYSNQSYYPVSERVTHDLTSDENGSLLSFIIDQIPKWKNKFSEEQKERLLKTGLFQMLFVYQHADASIIQSNANNYFLEIIQSDYKQLCTRDSAFYEGIAQILNLYANLYSEYSVILSPEAILVLAETYSGERRPLELNSNSATLLNETIIKRYFYIRIKKSGDKQYLQVRFLHDTLADEGWKSIQIKSYIKYKINSSLFQIINSLKTENTKDDLSSLIQSISPNNEILTQNQILSFCDFLIQAKTESPGYVKILFKDDFLDISNEKRIDYINKLMQLGISYDRIWQPIINWIKKHLSQTSVLTILNNLVKSEIVCNPVLSNFYRMLEKDELIKRVPNDFTAEKLLVRYNTESLFVFIERLGLHASIYPTICNFINTDGAEYSNHIFTACLKLIKKNRIARDAANRFLLLYDHSKYSECFGICIRILKDEEIAKEKARTYLNSVNLKYQPDVFVNCLIAVKGEPIANKKAREHINLYCTKNFNADFTTCLTVLDIEAFDIASEILTSPLGKYRAQSVYRSLIIFLKVDKQNPIIEKIVNQIFIAKNDIAFPIPVYNYYLQILKVSLFDISVWQNEVDRLLHNYKIINRNLFYSLTISHIDNSFPLADACIYIIRNWRNEFKHPKKRWGYFIRCLAHPTIQKQTELRAEVLVLCKDMVNASNCPFELQERLNFIANENIFPEWKMSDNAN